jgi:hypothetical protein
LQGVKDTWTASQQLSFGFRALAVDSPDSGARYHEYHGDRMATLQQQIADKFLKQLMESKEVSSEKIERLRAALSAAKTPKADDFLRIFTEPDHGDIK